MSELTYREAYRRIVDADEELIKSLESDIIEKEVRKVKSWSEEVETPEGGVST